MTTENENQDNNPANTSQPPRSYQGGYQGRPGGRGPRPGSGPEGGEGENSQEGQGFSGGRPQGGPPVRRPRRPGGKDRFAPRRKVCQFCVDQVKEVDYKDFQRLRRFLSDRGKIEPRRKTGTCARHQRSLTTAIKRARFLALLPYVVSQSR